eukprot:1090563-Rhodomonas_salina.1
MEPTLGTTPYAPTHVVLLSYAISGACYAMSGTELAYGATMCYKMSGTEVAYAACYQEHQG